MTALSDNFPGLFLPKFNTENSNSLPNTQSPCFDLNFLLHRQNNIVHIHKRLIYYFTKVAGKNPKSENYLILLLLLV